MTRNPAQAGVDTGTPDLESPDTLAALLCCLFEGPEIQRAASMLIEQAMAIEELRAAASSPNIRPQDAERDLCLALLACPHSMDKDRVVLYRNSNKEGGAYMQLANRLREAFVSLTSPDAEGGV